MKLAVDRIEGNIIVCQDLDTKEMIEIERKVFSFDLSDGDIIVFEDGNYKKDDNLKDKRRKEILEKFMKVKK